MTTAFATLLAASTQLADATARLVAGLQRGVVVVRDGRGAGSGVIWREDGLIVTNHHVVAGGRARVGLADGRTFDAAVLLRDPAHDLALLTIPATGLPAVSAGDSDRLRVGELVFAVGNPLGLSGAVTTGIVTAAPRSGNARGDGTEMVQADVSLAPGNSGGLLATAGGRVIGINAMVRAPGLALAVPSNRVTELLGRDAAGRAYLGLSLFETRLATGGSADRRERAGFVVTSVVEGGPAYEAGIMLGDVLLAAGGRQLDAAADLEQALADLRPGGALNLELLRGGQRRTLTATAGQTLDEAA